MGLAWCAAAVLVAALRAFHGPPRRSLWVWPAVAFVTIALLQAPAFEVAQFTLEGFAMSPAARL